MSLSHIEIITTCCIIAVRVRLINAYRAIGSYRRSKHTKSTTSLKPAAETNNFNPNFRQLRTNGPSMSAAQSTAVHDGLLHPHLRHCSSPASAVRRLPSAVRTATPAFHVRSSGLFFGRPGGLELVTRLPARSVTFL